MTPFTLAALVAAAYFWWQSAQKSQANSNDGKLTVGEATLDNNAFNATMVGVPPPKTPTVDQNTSSYSPTKWW